MSGLPKRKLTPAEYLAIERAAEFRSEFYDGEMFAMAGATWNHNVIMDNVVSELRGHFRGRPCRALSKEMRVRTDASGRYTYPDVIALCRPPQFEDAVLDTLINPELIVEVLSTSPRPYDHGAKFIRYRGIATFVEYVLISQTEPVIIRHNKQPDGTWLTAFIHGIDATLDLRSVGASIPLAEIYLNVEFPSDGAPATTAGA